jgi:hypothetical protein
MEAINKEVTFGPDVPLWLQRYVLKLHKLLTPEWTVVVHKSRVPVDPHDGDVDAETEPNFKYLDAKMVFGPKVINNVNGRRTVAHEFLHLVLHHLVIQTNSTTEEQTVTKLAKVIEHLT